MRTKTLLLASAALVAGVVASQAQSNVFSANIVGYVTVTNAANQYVVLANPLDNGTNDITGLLPTAPNGATVLVFQGGALQTSLKNKGNWSQNFVVPPGTGFFYKSPNDGTNTFVGNVAGFSNSIPAPANILELVGSPIPFSGTISDQGTNTMNLNVLPNGSTIMFFSGGALQTALKNKGNWSQNFTITPGTGFYVKSSADTNVMQILNLQ